MNRLQPPFQMVEPSTISQALDNATAGQELRLTVSGPDFDTGELKDTTVVMEVPAEGSGDERLDAFGLILLPEGDTVVLEEPLFGTPVSDQLSSFDFYGDTPVTLASVQAPASQLPKELVFIPALNLLGLIALMQRARIGRTKTEEVPA